MLFLAVVFVFSGTGAMGANILFISSMNYTAPEGDDQNMAGDDALKAFMEGLGHTVTYLDDDESEADTEAAAAAADLVFISESVSSGGIREEITEIEVPMIVTEAWAWDEMGLTQGGGTGIDVATTEIEIVEPGHSLAAGLSGTVPVLTDITDPVSGTARFSMGIAGEEATVIARATLSDGLTYEVLMVYEKGAALAQPPADGSGPVAADIRVCLGFDRRSYPLWNENAYALLEAAIYYALGISGPPVQAWGPRPRDGALDVAQNETLTWKAGNLAGNHNVYLGQVLEDVNEASVADPRGVLVSENQNGTTYNHPGLLEFGGTYYWRVDEINDVEPNSPWIGNLWSFSVVNYYVVDDFEDYNDYPPDEIFSTWSDGYEDLTNGSTVSYENPDFPNGEHYVETVNVYGGEQAMPFFYDNSTAGISEATMKLSALRNWTMNDVSLLSLWFRGNPKDFVEEPAGTYTVNASGVDIWGRADEFRFVYKQLSGPGSIIAKVESVEDTDPWAKGGVMIRQTLDAGSKFAGVYITPGNGCRFQGRLTPATDATSDTSVATTEQMAITAPYWVKLERDASNKFNGYYSSDGVSWQAMSWNPRNIAMPTDVYIGLAVTSHNPDAVCEATFSNVRTTGTVSPEMWTHEAFGVAMPSNDAAPMYIVLNDSAVVYHEDPAASGIDSWTEWVIDLKEFADQGVDLTDVDTIGIGIGERDNPQPDGSGVVYFDDIRIYLRTPEPKTMPEL